MSKNELKISILKRLSECNTDDSFENKYIKCSYLIDNQEHILILVYNENKYHWIQTLYKNSICILRNNTDNPYHHRDELLKDLLEALEFESFDEISKIVSIEIKTI